MGACIGAGLVLVHGCALGAERPQAEVAESGGEELCRVATHFDDEGCDVVWGRGATADGCRDVGRELADYGADGALEDRGWFGFGFVLARPRATRFKSAASM